MIDDGLADLAIPFESPQLGVGFDAPAETGEVIAARPDRTDQAAVEIVRVDLLAYALGGTQQEMLWCVRRGFQHHPLRIPMTRCSGERHAHR